MLEVRDLSKQFENFRLGPVSFKVDKGSHFVLLGPSGSGKSLILELISGFQKTDAGSIHINGVDITNNAVQKRSAAFIFQHAALFPHLSVKSNIAYSLNEMNLTRSEKATRIHKLAVRMSVSHLLKRKPATLSGGEIQRVSIARALAADPKILLLDEPLSALDVQMRASLREILAQLKNDGITMLHVTHDYEEAVRLADKVGIMHDGQLVQYGTMRQVFQSPSSGFVAHLTGQRNYYEAVLDEQPNDKLRVAHINGIQIRLFSKAPSGRGLLIIAEDQITLATSAPTLSAQNHLEGIVQSIKKLAVGTEAVIDAGVILHVKLTDESVENLKLFSGKAIHVFFKASAVRFLSF